MAPAGTYVEANGLQVYYEAHGDTAASQSWASHPLPPPSMRYPGLVRCLVLGGTQLGQFWHLSDHLESFPFTDE
jgi:hypothetical protein